MKKILFFLLIPFLFFSCESLQYATIENKSGDKIIIELLFHPSIGRDEDRLGWRNMIIKDMETNEDVTDNYSTDFTKNTKDSMTMIIELENNQSLEMSNGMNTSFAFFYLKSLKVTFSDGGEIFAKNSAIVNLFNIKEKPGYTIKKSIFRIEQSFEKRSYNSIHELQ